MQSLNSKASFILQLLKVQTQHTFVYFLDSHSALLIQQIFPMWGLNKKGWGGPLPVCQCQQWQQRSYKHTSCPWIHSPNWCALQGCNKARQFCNSVRIITGKTPNVSACQRWAWQSLTATVQNKPENFKPNVSLNFLSQLFNVLLNIPPFTLFMLTALLHYCPFSG